MLETFPKPKVDKATLSYDELVNLIVNNENLYSAIRAYSGKYYLLIGIDTTEQVPLPEELPDEDSGN